MCVCVCVFVREREREDKKLATQIFTNFFLG